MEKSTGRAQSSQCPHSKPSNSNPNTAPLKLLSQLLPQLKKFDGVTAVEWKSRREVGNEHQLRKVFKLIDTDGGGSLSQDELRASMKDPKIAELVGMDPIEIEPILIKILAAGGYDEECSFEDFCYWFSNAGSIGGM
eukprot:TRINITY_DN5046_c0_g1_i2.p1 TRINITY_DN5046_c0_g1~~TRINITY_DN5046_c0_g1_i2.p1  ORF type:complete len:137 (+),score=42.72 TRINITY_DN5046_c0_g1_i2:329-739(+)